MGLVAVMMSTQRWRILRIHRFLQSNGAREMILAGWLTQLLLLAVLIPFRLKLVHVFAVRYSRNFFSNMFLSFSSCSGLLLWVNKIY